MLDHHNRRYGIVKALWLVAVLVFRLDRTSAICGGGGGGGGDYGGDYGYGSGGGYGDDDCKDTDNGATDSYLDGCADYALVPSWCGGYDDDDFSSLEMCCACSDVVMPTATPTISPAPTTDCAPNCFGHTCEDWVGYGYSCDDLESLYGCNCADCLCAAPSPVPTLSTPPTISCADLDGDALDPYNDNCVSYALVPSWCGNFDDDDFSSLEMCCACGGGGSAPPTYSPTTASPTTSPQPTLVPTYTPTLGPTISVAPTGGCPATCFGLTCDYWNDLGYDDYTCSAMQNSYDCDCAGCTCSSDSYGDGGSDAYGGYGGIYGSYGGSGYGSWGGGNDGSYSDDGCVPSSTPSATPTTASPTVDGATQSPTVCFESCATMTCQAALQSSCFDNCNEATFTKGTFAYSYMVEGCCFDSYDDDSFNPFEYFPCPAQAVVSTSIGMGGLDCDDYGNAEEQIVKTSVASSIDGVEAEHIGDTTCVDGSRRRLQSAYAEINFDITMTVGTSDDDTTSSMSAAELATSVTSTLAVAASSGALEATIVNAAVSTGSGGSVLLAIEVASVETEVAVTRTMMPSLAPTQFMSTRVETIDDLGGELNAAMMGAATSRVMLIAAITVAALLYAV